MNKQDILEPINPSDDGFVKQDNNKSSFSLKQLTVALLIGGAAILGTYAVQPAQKQTQSETLVEETTTLESKDGGEQNEILGVFDEDKEDAVIEENVGFEDTRPELDLNLPFVDMDALIENDKATEAIINDDLEDFRVKHGVITKMQYWKNLPPDIKQNGNACSDQERKRILNGTERTLKVI